MEIFNQFKSLNRDQILEFLDEIDADVLLMDNMDEALIGIAQRPSEPLLAVYSYDLIIKILMERDSMSYEDAYDFYEHNIGCAWVGEYTPIIVHSFNSFMDTDQS